MEERKKKISKHQMERLAKMLRSDCIIKCSRVPRKLKKRVNKFDPSFFRLLALERAAHIDSSAGVVYV